MHPTSDIWERLSSSSGHILNDLCRGLSPTILETQRFLHLIKDLWVLMDFTNIPEIRGEGSDEVTYIGGLLVSPY